MRNIFLSIGASVIALALCGEQVPVPLLDDVDSDEDGISDRLELYWYGGLAQDGQSDTDGDGRTFAEEIASGSNPLLKDESSKGGIVWRDGELVQYNPHRIPAYTVRSEPEGVLCETSSDYVEQGTEIPMPSIQGNFAYWTVNGVRQADRFGRAKDVISPVMTDVPTEIVAVAEDDETKRQALYWYGTTGVDASSDTDGDGRTFAEEIASGSNPLLKDESSKGGIVQNDEIVEGIMEITAEGWVLDADTAARIQTICRTALKHNQSISRLVVRGDSEIVPVTVDLGIAPALEQSGSDMYALYSVPELKIIDFEPQTGRIRIKITPGEGNSIREPLDTRCIHAYGTHDLSEEMKYISGTAVDSAGYLQSDSRGEADLDVDIGSHSYIKVKAER